MKIKKVVIVCFKKDVFLLRSCVASVKYWHPEVDIFLLKDLLQGDFDTMEIETYFGAKVFKTIRDKWGWGWAKIAPIITAENERYLVLDSDTVMIGRVLDKLSEFSEDFIVTGVEDADENSRLVNSHYIDVQKTKEIFPDYRYPGYAFNTGQFICTGGKIRYEDFAEVVEFGQKVTSKYPDVFKYADQGVINYVIAKKSLDRTVTVAYSDFWMWPALEAAQDIKMSDIVNKTAKPVVLHWAGIKPVNITRFKRYDILSFYNEEYYKKVPNGFMKKKLRLVKKQAVAYAKILSYKVRGVKYAK